MSAACTKFAEDVTPVYDTVGKPIVEAKVCGDDSLYVVVTAGQNTSYYGYVVVEGTLEGVSADKLVANGYEKAENVVVQGEEKAPQSAYYKYSEETKADTLCLSSLTPYTDYTVYAAAVSPMGVLSEVVAVTVKTTDGTEPVMAADDAEFEEADSVLTFAIPFSDPVVLTGEGSAKAYFYAENYYNKETGELLLYKEVEIDSTHMATSANYLILAVPAKEYIPGAMVCMTYSANIVVNGAGSKNVAFENKTMKLTKEGLYYDGIVGQYEYVNWDFSLVDPATLPDEEAGEGAMDGEDEEEVEKVPEYFQDWESLYMLNYTTSKYPLYSITSDADVTIWSTESNDRTISYTADKYDVVSDKMAVVMLSEAPAYGSFVSYTIAEGSFCDIFGNVNNEFTAEDEYYYSCGYTVADIAGSYTMTGSSLFVDGLTLSYPLVVAASDNEEKGNIMFTTYFGIEGKLYCDFNVHSGEIIVKEGAIFADGYATYFYGQGAQKFNFVSGKISNFVSYVMVATVEDGSMTGYAKDANGNLLGLYNVVATLN